MLIDRRLPSPKGEYSPRPFHCVEKQNHFIFDFRSSLDFLRSHRLKDYPPFIVRSKEFDDRELSPLPSSLTIDTTDREY